MVDNTLVDRSLKYHGSALIDKISTKQPQIQMPSFLNVPSFGMGTKQKNRDGDPRVDSIIENFIALKSHLLFKQSDTPDLIYDSLVDDDKETDQYSIMPPIENFMDIPPEERKHHLIRCLEKGDVVCGVVNSILEFGITISILCIQRGPIRDLTGMRINAICPLKELPKTGAHEDPLASFSIKDTVRVVILSIIENEKITVSMNSRYLKPDHSDLFLGTITHEDFPIHFKRLLQQTNGNFVKQVKNDPGFNNLTSTHLLTNILGLKFDMCYSFIENLHNKTYRPDECADHLRKIQSQTFASNSVAKGVKEFRNGNYTEALQYFNKALNMDDDNIDAYVARGVLHANNENYIKALEDFDKAEKIQPEHKNAKKYRLETLLEYAFSLKKNSKFSESREILNKALLIDPNCEEAKEMLIVLMPKNSPVKELPLLKKRQQVNYSKKDINLDDKIRHLISTDKELHNQNQNSASSETSDNSDYDSTNIRNNMTSNLSGRLKKLTNKIIVEEGSEPVIRSVNMKWKPTIDVQQNDERRTVIVSQKLHDDRKVILPNNNTNDIDMRMHDFRDRKNIQTNDINKHSKEKYGHNDKSRSRSRSSSSSSYHSRSRSKTRRRYTRSKTWSSDSSAGSISRKRHDRTTSHYYNKRRFKKNSKETSRSRPHYSKSPLYSSNHKNHKYYKNKEYQKTFTGRNRKYDNYSPAGTRYRQNSDKSISKNRNILNSKSYDLPSSKINISTLNDNETNKATKSTLSVSEKQELDRLNQFMESLRKQAGKE